MLHGQLERLVIESRLLSGNPLGDPHRRELFVYTPPGYGDGGRYPLVMMLAGYAATHRSIFGFHAFEANTLERLDAQIVRGECPATILVLPDAMNRWGGSQYLDSDATGAYQSYLVEEVLPLVDARFRSLPQAESRAVVGRSSGGFGALRLVMDRPGIFGALASHAGDAAFDETMRPMLTQAAIAYDRAGGVERFAEQLVEGGPGDGLDFDGAFILAASAAYAPEMDRPMPHTRPPFDPRTAEIDPERWGRWLAQDPLRRIDASAEALRGLRLIFLDAGGRDEHGLQFAARRLASALRELGAQVVHEEFEGGHRGTSYRYSTSLPAILEVLERE
ncbi:MAG: esterase family protein [Deltaproteobacteria bacterium]|nr:esterase family protein [Deltaproteobacteria bacterium]